MLARFSSEGWRSLVGVASDAVSWAIVLVWTISFNIGLCFLLVLACRLYRSQERVVPIAALLVMCFFVHMIVYASALLMVFLYCLQYRRWKLMYVGMGTVPLVFWYFAGRLLMHSNESEYGYSPVSHVALPCLVALALLGVGFFGHRGAIQRFFARILIVLSLSIVAGALISVLVPAAHLSARVLSTIFVLQLKALHPFMLFGFVNMVHTLVDQRLFSSTLHLLHEPLFLVLLLADVIVGAIIIGDIARLLMARRGRAGTAEESTEDTDFYGTSSRCSGFSISFALRMHWE
jgi:hypothetical protein